MLTLLGLSVAAGRSAFALLFTFPIEAKPLAASLLPILFLLASFLLFSTLRRTRAQAHHNPDHNHYYHHPARTTTVLSLQSGRLNYLTLLSTAFAHPFDLHFHPSVTTRLVLYNNRLLAHIPVLSSLSRRIPHSLHLCFLRSAPPFSLSRRDS